MGLKKQLQFHVLYFWAETCRIRLGGYHFFSFTNS